MRIRRLGVTLLLVLALAGCGGASKEQQVVAKATNGGVAWDESTATPTPDPTETPSAADAMAIQSGRGDDPRATASAAGHKRSTAIFSVADARSFDRLAARLSGSVGVAVSGVGQGRKVASLGSLKTAVAWSTSKVPVAMAVVAGGGASAQQTNLAKAITQSDNTAALALWASLGGGAAAASAATEQVRAAGDARTQVESQASRGSAYTPFGQTAWRLTDQTRFVAGMGCSDAGQSVLDLMGNVVAGQRWGLGATGLPARFKGGWGPGVNPGQAGGWLDRQVGIVEVKGRPLAVSIATTPADGAHGTGTSTLTALAKWVVKHADVSRLPSGGDAGCG